MMEKIKFFLVEMFAAKYDYDGKKSMELRQEFMQRGKEEGWTFLFYHDTKEPTARF